jgi:hypothetical protein
MSGFSLANRQKKNERTHPKKHSTPPTLTESKKNERRKTKQRKKGGLRFPPTHHLRLGLAHKRIRVLGCVEEEVFFQERRRHSRRTRLRPILAAFLFRRVGWA